MLSALDRMDRAGMAPFGGGSATLASAEPVDTGEEGSSPSRSNSRAEATLSALDRALEAVAQAGREAGHSLRQSPANQWQWRCLNLAGMYRSGGDYERARRFLRMSREWRVGGDREGPRRTYPRTGARSLGFTFSGLLCGEEE